MTASAPALPARLRQWSPATLVAWRALWRAPQAASWDRSGPTMWRWAVLVNDLPEAGPARRDALMAELRAIEVRYGLLDVELKPRDVIGEPVNRVAESAVPVAQGDQDLAEPAGHADREGLVPVGTDAVWEQLREVVDQSVHIAESLGRILVTFGRVVVAHDRDRRADAHADALDLLVERTGLMRRIAFGDGDDVPARPWVAPR